MNDNALFALVRGIILDGIAARGLGMWKVARDFPPDHQGASSTPTVYLHKIIDKRHGFPQRKSQWDQNAQVVNSAESQQYETNLQASVLMQETTDPNALTPSDALNVVAAIMQADEALAALRAQEVGILRVGEVRNPYNKNDANRFQAEPSFDFTLTHRRGWQRTTPVAVSVDGSVNRV